MQCVCYYTIYTCENSFLTLKHLYFTTQKKFCKQIWPWAILQNLFSDKPIISGRVHVTMSENLKIDFQRTPLLREVTLCCDILFTRLSIHERQFDTTNEECSLRSGLNAEGSSCEDLFVFRFTHEFSCIGLEQRNASFLTSAGFSLDNVESWFGVLSLSWEESVDSFVSISDSSLSGVSSLGILLAVAPCSASSKCTTITLVLSARSSLSRHLDNARWINLSKKFEIVGIYMSLSVVEWMIAKTWVAVLWHSILIVTYM